MTPTKTQLDTANQLRECVKTNPEGPHTLSSWQLITIAELLEIAAPAPAQSVNAELVDKCIEAAIDAIAFNGGTVQMEAHVRAALAKVKGEK
jgi:hypothetical protein